MPLPRIRDRFAAALLGAALLALAITGGVTSQAQSPSPGSGLAPWAPPGLEKIEHIVMIVQENRSFDQYFGTYRSPSGEKVSGIPRKTGGAFAVCVPDPILKKCVRPYHSKTYLNQGGPHGYPHAVIDINKGKMDGFVRAVILQGKPCALHPFAKKCDGLVGPRRQPDVMSFHTKREIPNYWTYADNFVLQDRMFESVDSWTLPAHLYLVSGWSARCSDPNDPMSCKADFKMQGVTPHASPPDDPPISAWTDITYLLAKAGVSWSYYVGNGTCFQTPCTFPRPLTSTPPGWNPLPGFTTVRTNGQVGNIKPHSALLTEAAAGTLPQVAWVIPDQIKSEHPGHGSLAPGYTYVTETINALMQSPEWPSMAIFLTWDDWGGFYDHVKPPRIDEAGYGLRVPGLLISPYAKTAYVDHQVLSPDAYLKLIEDRFLTGQRIDPATDGRPDPRSTVRENAEKLGDLTEEFDFAQTPRPPLLLDPTPPGG